MKYLLLPFWFLACFIAVFLNMIFFSMIWILFAIWEFKITKTIHEITWKNYTERYDYITATKKYDNTPVDTFIRYFKVTNDL